MLHQAPLKNRRCSGNEMGVTKVLSTGHAMDHPVAYQESMARICKGFLIRDERVIVKT